MLSKCVQVPFFVVESLELDETCITNVNYVLASVEFGEFAIGILGTVPTDADLDADLANCVNQAFIIEEETFDELGYTCTRPDYLVDDGHACANIDECSIDLNNCGDNTSCDDNDNEISMQTDFTCSCIDGYDHDTSVPDMIYCKNIDECATGANNCAEKGSECTDNNGGWEYGCNAGYHGDGVTRTDHYECIGENNGHFWGVNTSCNNLPENFECN